MIAGEELVASVMSVYNPIGNPTTLFILLVLSLNLMSIYFSYQIGYIRGHGALIVRMNEVIETVNDANEASPQEDK